MPSNIQQAPVAFGLIALSAIVFLLVYQLRLLELVALFNFVPFAPVPGGGIRFGTPGTEVWRFVTPTLLHFGWMHIAFNCLWLWEFGSRIEARVGSLNLLGLFLVSAIFSNSVQYFWSGPSIFGGMSGVVYALLGFLWSGALVNPGWVVPPPQPVIGFMLLWLVIGLVGALEFVGVGAIANGAHLGGLFIGLTLGAVFGLMSRARR